MSFFSNMTGWILVISGSILVIPVITTITRFYYTHSFRNLAWTLSFFTLLSGMFFLGISIILNNPQFLLISSIFIFFFVFSVLWTLFIGYNLWYNEQRAFSLVLAILPWVFIVVVNPLVGLPHFHINFHIWSAIALTILFCTWFFSFISSRLKKLDMRMSISTFFMAIASWILVFDKTPEGMFLISILFLFGIILMTYTWVNYGQKTD